MRLLLKLWRHIFGEFHPRDIFGKFHPRYIPLLMVYFAYGASGFTLIAETFWVKECLDLSAEALIAIAFWISVPWTIKMVFGQFIDSVRVFGSGRRIYIFIGASLIALGYIILMGLASQWPWLMQAAAPGTLYLISVLISVVGFVLQDVTADAMSTEVVSREDASGNPRPQNKIDAELAQVQWWGRLALMVAGVIVAGLGGWLAQIFSYPTMFALGLIIPAISITGAIFVRLTPVSRSCINWWILGGGLAFAAFVVAAGYLEIPYGQEVVFVVSLVTISFLISRVGITKPLVFSAIVIFLFRAMPQAGPGVSWWMIDDLGFDKHFQGILSQIGAAFGIIGLLVFRKYIIEKPIGFTLAWLTIAGAIVTLPTIGLFFGVHEWLGVSARTVALVDTTIAAPLGQLSMVPLLTIVARSCPKGQAGTWFALMASLMNLALSAAQLGTKYLNQIFVVSRGNYENIGTLLISSWLFTLIIPLAAIFILLRKMK